MKIIGVTARTADTVHTYIIKEKLEQATRKLRYTRRIETQGGIEIKEQLIPGETQETDAVILAINVKISEENRFKGKPVMRMSTEKTMKNTGIVPQDIEEVLTRKKNGGD